MKKFSINDRVTNENIVGIIKNYRKINDTYYYHVHTINNKYLISEYELKKVK